MDPLASRERRETEACPDPRVLLEARATVVLVALQVLSVLLVLQACLVLEVLRDLRVHRVLLVRRETPVRSVHLVLLVPLAR